MTEVASALSFSEIFGIDQPVSLHQSVLEAEMVLATGIILEAHTKAELEVGRCRTALNMAAGRVECDEAMREFTAAEDALEQARIRKDAAECHITDMFGDQRMAFMAKVDELRT